MKLKIGRFEFPYNPKAFQILQSILPESYIEDDLQALPFVLRAYGKAITGQNINVERIELPKSNKRVLHIALLNYGDSFATQDRFSKKTVAIEKFNEWLVKEGIAINITPNKNHIQAHKLKRKQRQDASGSK